MLLKDLKIVIVIFIQMLLQMLFYSNLQFLQCILSIVLGSEFDRQKNWNGKTLATVKI